MTKCIIEQEKALGKAICLALKDIDCIIDLGKEFLCIKISVAILSGLKHNMGLSA